jgi:hypothetical protein
VRQFEKVEIFYAVHVRVLSDEQVSRSRLSRLLRSVQFVHSRKRVEDSNQEFFEVCARPTSAPAKPAEVAIFVRQKADRQLPGPAMLLVV